MTASRSAISRESPQLHGGADRRLAFARQRLLTAALGGRRQRMQYGALLVLAVLAALYLAVWLFTRTRLGAWVEARVERREPIRMLDPIYALLREEVEVLGKELEALPYERLLALGDTAVYRKVVVNVERSFNAELVSVARNGDLHICIDAWAHAPHWRRRDVLPSYNFKKHKDGTVSAYVSGRGDR
jgi:hypothetical protein